MLRVNPLEGEDPAPRLGAAQAPLRILHVLRAPVGGLFRHVRDLAQEQIARGHQVGLIADSLTGGETAERYFDMLKPQLALGLLRVPIFRLPHPSDLGAIVAVNRRIAEIAPDVIHGHGSKGGMLARSGALVAPAGTAIRCYTPHGGSLNYRPGSLAHRLFMSTERLLATRTDALLFESAFIANRFENYVGRPSRLARVIPNGVSAAECEPVAPRADAADLLYVGEFRAAKGLDTLLAALARLAATGTRPSLMLVGDGPDRRALEEQAERLGLARQIAFGGPRPAREAFALGRVMVVPSRAESLPYIVLEAAGARVPLVATNVGGVPEIFGPYADRLIEAGDPDILAKALERVLAETPDSRRAKAEALAAHVSSRFSLSRMVDDILGAYREAIDRRQALPLRSMAA